MGSKEKEGNTSKKGRKVYSMKVVLFVIFYTFFVAQVYGEALEGWLVDRYCWDDLGKVALDTGGDLGQDPSDHSLHCLVEVGICRNSGFLLTKKDGDLDFSRLGNFDDAAN